MTQSAQPDLAPSSAAKRNWFLRHWFISLLALGIGSCAFIIRDRSVSWEEEVLLNTGETIVVKRWGMYEYGFETGGGYVGYQPNWRSTIEFAYRGRRYEHTDAAYFMLLAIDPNGAPNLVALATGYDWHTKNNYHCVVPSYVQFRPDSTGKQWTWPNQIEPWLHKLPTNLVFGLVPIEANGMKYSAEDRVRENASSLVMGEHVRQIDPNFNDQRCLRRN